jgi:ferredoxin-NADP reductase
VLEQFTTEVLATELCGHDVLMLRFARPAGYDFRAGQWFRLTLQTEQGTQTETFSHAAAPSDRAIEMATRLSGSAFKEALSAVSVGDPVTISASGGRLSLDDATVRAGFLAGGVGITPIRGILRDRAARGLPFDDAVLFFGNRDIACVPWGGDLEALARIGLRLVHVPETAPQGWTGESGFIDAAMIARHAHEPALRPWMVAGPPVMVSVMESVLDELHVPQVNRIIERFGAPSPIPPRN